MSFRVTDCIITTNSITIKFSDTLSTTTNPGNNSNNDNFADNLQNYTVFSASSVDFNESPTATIDDVNQELEQETKPKVATLSIGGDNKSIKINFSPSTGTNEFEPGDFVHVVVRNVQSESGDRLDVDPAMLANVVRGRISRATRDVEDAISYPILTEDISQRQSPVSTPSSGGASGGLGLVAAKAVSDVLGWKPNAADPKGFISSLTNSFTLTDVEGHVESTWTPRTYAVQTDLGGGITGAQASLYTRAKSALDSTLPLLDGLYPLDPEADPEYVKALREMARSQMGEIVKELGTVGLPSILRIDIYFKILLGQSPAEISSVTPIIFDPDKIGGTLGDLRDEYGIEFAGNEFNNSVEDEQDITNFRVISDYMTSLMQSWVANRQFFLVNPKQSAFFGTQLVLIARQFNVIAETVDEVRFALDSVFIGPNERQALLLDFGTAFSPMFVEDILREVEKFSTDEGPRLLRDGGKISVTNNLLPVAQSLRDLIEQAHRPTNYYKLPNGFRTARVQHSLDDLQRQITDLIKLIDQVKQTVPEPEDKFAVTGFNTTNPNSDGNFKATLFGNDFEQNMGVGVHSATATTVDPRKIEFWSAQRVDIHLNIHDYTAESHDIVLTKNNGASITVKDVFIGTGSVVSGRAMRPGNLPGSTSSGGEATMPVVGKNPTETGDAAPATPQQGAAVASDQKIAQMHKDLTGKVESLQKTVDERLDRFFEEIKGLFDGKSKAKNKSSSE